ncbi:MAG: hypothetical protein ACI8V9_000508 [Flavobacteriaceae bacterium]
MKGVVGLKIDWLVKGVAKEALDSFKCIGQRKQPFTIKILIFVTNRTFLNLKGAKTYCTFVIWIGIYMGFSL